MTHLKELFKEIGKYLFDISKIVLGLAIVTPLVKEGSLSVYPIFISLLLFSSGATLIYLGGKK